MAGNTLNMKKIICILPACVLAILSCTEIKDTYPHGSTEVPGTVKIKDIVNDYGRSVIYYELPDDSNLHYVKAIYTPRPGETAEVNASFMTDSLVVDGFKEATDYSVDLVSVSYGGTRSDPVKTTVSPKTPPYQLAIQQLDCNESFGGFTVRTINPTKAALDIVASRKNEQGQWEDLGAHYTSLANVFWSVRGQEPVPTTFRVTVRDHWGNSFDSEEMVFTPLEEYQLDRTEFRGLLLYGDATLHPTINKGVAALFDGGYPSSFDESYSSTTYHTAVGTPMPQHFSFDMGSLYRLSRMVVFYRHVFSAGCPHFIEIYGATELNPDPMRELYDANGVLDPYWTLLASLESVRPSGETNAATIVPLTDEERRYNYSWGEEFEIDGGTPPVRYIRYRTMSTWGETDYVELNELILYGAAADNDN